jgi:uncharacterized protein YqeY
MIKQQIQEDMKTAMRSKDAARLSVIRLILAAVKQIEVDERIEIDDVRMLAILSKMLKQRQDSITQYQAGNRQDLADQEQFEIGIIHTYLPAPLSEDELDKLITQSITDSQASSIQDMGKVMNNLRPQLQGRADMGLVSQKIKQKLAAL